jgi:hypothetical protein
MHRKDTGPILPASASAAGASKVQEIRTGFHSNKNVECYRYKNLIRPTEIKQLEREAQTLHLLLFQKA